MFHVEVWLHNDKDLFVFNDINSSFSDGIRFFLYSSDFPEPVFSFYLTEISRLLIEVL